MRLDERDPMHQVQMLQLQVTGVAAAFLALLIFSDHHSGQRSDRARQCVYGARDAASAEPQKPASRWMQLRPALRSLPTRAMRMRGPSSRICAARGHFTESSNAGTSGGGNNGMRFVGARIRHSSAHARNRPDFT